MLGIGITIVLVHLAIGATLWALWLHPLDRARDIPLSILTWPRHAARWLAKQVRELRDLSDMRRHCR